MSALQAGGHSCDEKQLPLDLEAARVALDLPLTHQYTEKNRGVGLVEMLFAREAGRAHRASVELAITSWMSCSGCRGPRRQAARTSLHERSREYRCEAYSVFGGAYQQSFELTIGPG